MNLRDALQRTARDEDDRDAGDAAVGSAAAASIRTTQSSSSRNAVRADVDDAEARQIATVLEAIEQVTDDSSLVAGVNRNPADYSDPFVGIPDVEVGMLHTSLLPPEPTDALEDETPPVFSSRLRLLEPYSVSPALSDGREIRDETGRIVGYQRVADGYGDPLSPNTEATASVGRPRVDEPLPPVESVLATDGTAPFPSSEADPHADAGSDVQPDLWDDAPDQSPPAAANLDLASLSSVQWAGATVSSESLRAVEDAVAFARASTAGQKTAGLEPTEIPDVAAGEPQPVVATDAVVEPQLTADAAPIVEAEAIAEPQRVAEPSSLVDATTRSAEPDVGIEPSAFESSIVAALQTPRVMAQYRALWEGLRSETEAHSLRMFGLLSVEYEPHLTQTVGHLAVLLSRHEGLHVLLVDANRTRRLLSGYFGLEGVVGLADVCAQQAAWDEAIRPTSHSNMCILPAGRTLPDAGEFPAGMVPSLVEKWKGMFDVILVDIGDPQAGFAAEIYPACDANYVLIRLGKTHRDLVDDVVAALTDENVALRGCIVTNVP